MKRGVAQLSLWQAQNWHSVIVSIILRANANPSLQRDNGATPLFMAAQEGHSDSVSILLQANANPNLQRDNGVITSYDSML